MKTLEGKTVYLSGPMTGYPDDNYPAFEEYHNALQTQQKVDDVYNPVYINNPEDPYTDQLASDVGVILKLWRDHRTRFVVGLMPGWSGSCGATAEAHVAYVLGVPLYNLSILKDGKLVLAQLLLHPRKPWGSWDLWHEDAPKDTPTRSSKPAESICEEAHRIVNGDRGNNYGHPLNDFGRTVALFKILTGISIRPEDFATLMICCKLSRESNGHQRDNLTDICGYALTKQRIHDEYLLEVDAQPVEETTDDRERTS